ncbi:serine/arginine repetitive matrix protein 2-like [Mastomys coucha]|uniref:serine/arginine repetitive matrix protein 2-like n=1 Tax=Mastomys coucha TaxID=35658 RepID=UPI001261A05C|nr:serine/arginine repetitive matrix protein 2-like [Mastomys coucha]
MVATATAATTTDAAAAGCPNQGLSLSQEELHTESKHLEGGGTIPKQHEKSTRRIQICSTSQLFGPNYRSLKHSRVLSAGETGKKAREREKKNPNPNNPKKPGGPGLARGRRAGRERGAWSASRCSPSAPRDQPPPKRPRHGRGPPAPRHPAGLRRGRRARGGRSALARTSRRDELIPSSFTRAPKVPRSPLPRAAPSQVSLSLSSPGAEPRCLTGPGSLREQCRARGAEKRARSCGAAWRATPGRRLCLWESATESLGHPPPSSSSSSSSFASSVSSSSSSSSSSSLKHTPSPRPQHSNRTWRLRSPRPIRAPERRPRQREAVSREVKPRPHAPPLPASSPVSERGRLPRSAGTHSTDGSRFKHPSAFSSVFILLRNTQPCVGIADRALDLITAIT